MSLLSTCECFLYLGQIPIQGHVTEGMLIYNPLKLDLDHSPFKAEGLESN